MLAPAYVELPGGKILSGSEDGGLLLWDGNLIQLDVRTTGGQPCHNGAVEVMFIQVQWPTQHISLQQNISTANNLSLLDCVADGSC